MHHIDGQGLIQRELGDLDGGDPDPVLFPCGYVRKERGRDRPRRAWDEVREVGGDVRPGPEFCRPDMRVGSRAGTLLMACSPFVGGRVYETVSASEKRKAS